MRRPTRRSSLVASMLITLSSGLALAAYTAGTPPTGGSQDRSWDNTKKRYKYQTITTEDCESCDNGSSPNDSLTISVTSATWEDLDFVDDVSTDTVEDGKYNNGTGYYWTLVTSTRGTIDPPRDATSIVYNAPASPPSPCGDHEESVSLKLELRDAGTYADDSPDPSETRSLKVYCSWLSMDIANVSQLNTYASKSCNWAVGHAYDGRTDGDLDGISHGTTTWSSAVIKESGDAWSEIDLSNVKRGDAATLAGHDVTFTGDFTLDGSTRIDADVWGANHYSWITENGYSNDFMVQSLQTVYEDNMDPGTAPDEDITLFTKPN